MKRDIVIIDVETTGLDARCHELIEAAVLRCTPSLEVIGAAHVYIMPERPGEGLAEAYAVNGFSVERWCELEAVTLREGLEVVAPLLRGAIMAGHCVAFDLGFMLAGLEACDMLEDGRPPWYHHAIDTVSLAAPLYIRGELNSLSLASLCSRFQISNERPHAAESDARATLELLRHLSGLYGPERGSFLPMLWRRVVEAWRRWSRRKLPGVEA